MQRPACSSIPFAAAARAAALQADAEIEDESVQGS